MSQRLSEIRADRIEAISSDGLEPQWLREYRRNSWSVYSELPIETSPLYNKYTDAKRMDPTQVVLDGGTSAVRGSEPGFLRGRLAELSDEPSIIQMGSVMLRINNPPELSSQGVVLSSIRDAINDNPDLVRGALESSDPVDDKFTALNNAAFNSGMFVYVPDGVQLKKPIHLLMCLPDNGHSAISRNMLVLGRSSASVVVQELYSQKSDAQQAYLELLNTVVGEGSRLDVTTLQMLDQTSVNFSTRLTSLAQDSKVNWYSGMFGSMLTRYRIDYFLRGTGASANDSEVIFGNGEQSFDIQTNVNHESPFTEGRVVEKSILRDRSRSLFKGMIRIRENATKSNSFLSGRSILLDPDAKSDAIPGLEIFTNDVKATHSASVAQIDEEQIFYLMSRCLSREESERTIVEGFLEPLSRKMSYQVRAWIAYLIESKWEGRDLGINTDEELAKFVEVEETRYNEDAEIEQHYKYR